jgi:guanyl-specific ribonuclease Sa
MHSSKFLVLSLSLLLFSQSASAAQLSGANAAPAPVNKSPSENMAHPSELPESRSSNDPIPTAPKPVSRHGLKLIRQAGVGGPTAYARNGVLELGGQLSFTGANHYKNLTFTPGVGYFITDNFQLSGLVGLNYTKTNAIKKINVTAVLEPSIHLPIIDQAFVFAGLGLGIAYHQGHGTGFALARGFQHHGRPLGRADTSV